MSDIAVECQQARQGWTCTVTVTDGWGTQRFEVVVSDAELARFAPGATEPLELVRRSFEFLLAREAKESILPAFALSTILRYFPEYERTIVREMASATGTAAGSDGGREPSGGSPVARSIGQGSAGRRGDPGDAGR